MFKLVLIVVSLMAFSSYAQVPCSQLLQDPGCEPGFAAWTTTAGSWSCLSPTSPTFNPATQPQPHGGANFFFADQNPVSVLEQTISVTAYSPSIAAGMQEFWLRGYVASALQTPSDTSQVDFDFLDASGSVLLANSSGPVASQMAWMAVGFRRTAPIGTTDLRVRFRSVRNNGSNNDGYYDDFTLVALPVSGLGQANSVAALLDINATASGNPGPFLVPVFVPASLTFAWSGTPNHAWYLILGSLSPGATNLGCIGTLDLLSPFVFLSGSLDSSGLNLLTISTANIPVGVVAGVQGFVLTPGSCIGQLTASFCISVF